jgi:hypothetical protein
MHLSPSYNYASGDLGMFMMVDDGWWLLIMVNKLEVS